MVSTQDRRHQRHTRKRIFLALLHRLLMLPVLLMVPWTYGCPLQRHRTAIVALSMLRLLRLQAEVLS